MTVRNLRIREDTAKYLYNLDVNGPYYDPKTRSMRENPFLDTGLNPTEWDIKWCDYSEQMCVASIQWKLVFHVRVKYAGDNFVRNSGDTVKMAQAQGAALDLSLCSLFDYSASVVSQSMLVVNCAIAECTSSLCCLSVHLCTHQYPSCQHVCLPFHPSIH